MFSLLSIIRVVSSVYLRLSIFLPAILIPTCASSSPAFLMMYSAYKLNKYCLFNLYNIHSLDVLFSQLEPVRCSMSGSYCYFLTRIQISQEAGKVVWYSHLFQNFPQFAVIHTVTGFSLVNKAVDVFLELSCFLNNPTDVGSLISGSSDFSKTSLNIWKFSVHILSKPGLENFEHYFLSM